MSAQPRDIEILRQPPCSIEAEQSVLGGLLLAPAALASIADWLAVEDFYRREHRLIYAAIRALAERREPLDAVTLLQRLEADAVRDQVPLSYLYELMNNTPGASNITAWAEIVVEHSKLRKLIEIGTQLAGKGFDRGSQSELAIADAIHALSAMQTSRLRGGLQSAKALLRQWMEDLATNYQRGDAITGMPTPWPDLDRLTHGLQAGDLILIAARPNMGKSVMGMQLGVHAATALKLQTAIFSLEMTSTQVLNRATAALGDIPHDWLLSPRADETYWPRVSEAAEQMQRAPLWIDDTPGLTIDQIAARARRANLQHRVRLLIVDHLHEIRLAGRTSADRAHELGEAAGALKALGKEFDCPVVALAQLNRALATRASKRPEMTDLRASGDIEQKADVILFLHRDDYYDRNTHLKGVVDVEVGKGRNIPTGARVQLRNRFDVMRLDPWTGELPLPEPSDRPTRSERWGGFRPRRTNGDEA